METEETEDLVERLVFALQMMSAGFEMKRAQLERRHPNASSEELDRLFGAWLQDDPKREVVPPGHRRRE